MQLTDPVFLISMIPTIIGYLVMAYSMVFIFIKPNKDRFWFMFSISSFLMSSALIVGANVTEKDFGFYLGVMIVSALCWAVFWLVYMVANGSKSDYVNTDNLPSHVGDVLISDTDKILYYALLDQGSSRGDVEGEINFRYKLIKYTPVDIFNNKFDKTQYYKVVHIENNFKSVEAVREFLKLLKSTPILLNE